jgi:5-oxoprolinase (ATP-hydrolysing)
VKNETNPREFWIDVGGTFTDCLARRPDGRILTHKLLSTSTYKGKAAPGSKKDLLVDPQRSGDPDGFFEGFQLRCGGETVRVHAFQSDGGKLLLDRPLKTEVRPGMTYELQSDEEAPVTGIRWLLGRRLADPIGAVRVRLGTTLGTNALLERRGARTAFVTTQGFGDVLRIAYQNRPKLFQLNIRKPRELFEEVVELDERLDRNGRVIRPLDERETRAKLSAVRAKGIASLAVCLMNAYRNDAHERTVERIGTELGFEYVSCQVTRLQKIVSRGDTTVVDAYLTPVIRGYVRAIRRRMPEASIQLMTSAGGLVDADRFAGAESILSGPAGGVVGQAWVARQAGFGKSIGFDMGGTSTDVSRFDGDYERRFEMELHDAKSDTGVRIVAPMLAVETVAAGGGSICSFDGQKPVVGPESAGADPGPACYGRGGPLCVTDVNLHLGRILPDRFAFPLDRGAVETRLGELIDRIAAATGRQYRPEELAAGFVAIANANMAAPIKKVSVAQGYDVREYVLVSFGGAGAQHACAIARELGIRRILQHPYASLLSAYGIGMADVKKFAARDVCRPYDEAELGALEPLFAGLEADLTEQVRKEGVSNDRIRPPQRLLEMRYAGQEAQIGVKRPPDGKYGAEFERLHHVQFGFTHKGRPIEVYAARVEVTGETAKPDWPIKPASGHRRPRPGEATRTWFQARWQETGVFQREDLQPGDRISGPAIIVEPTSTIVVEPGWEAELTERDDLLLTDQAELPKPEAFGTDVDAIQLELFNNRFASIAEQMGATMQKTALSTNVKERLDFSCALFDPAGNLVVNAPHIPVHLGAMSECVRRIMAEDSDLRSGDVIVTNDPYRGGSHLPDVTVVTPVFDAAGSRILFFVASRAHHAEIGGITPGSMPPSSRTLEEEGVVIRSFRLVRGGRMDEGGLKEILSRGPYPSRAVRENIADINAQLAANRIGVEQLAALVARHGIEAVHAYMRHIQRAAENKMRAALLKIPEGEHRYVDHLDDGSPIAVTITVRHAAGGGEATIDFTGTGPVLAGNLNATPPIVASAVLYSFRCLIDEDIPLNAGIMSPLTIRLPENCLLNPPADADPAKCAAVVGGNVETSQRIVDAILGALGVAAASQGTMNNLTFGDATFGYYETLCGGSGATATGDGAHAVHTHMTNTRLTDPEVLEDRYPVRLVEFAIRRGSGGAGRRRGGDGAVRRIEFLRPLQVSLLTERRGPYAPFGLEGGAPGALGLNTVWRRGNSKEEALPGKIHVEVEAGDVLTIQTPGGGGYGTAGR